MCDQYDDIIMKAFPNNNQEFGKNDLPKEIFELKPILKQCIGDMIRSNPDDSYHKMIFDKKFLDFNYKTRNIDSFLTEYTFEDTLLKPAARSSNNFLTVNVNKIALQTAIEQKESGETFADFKDTLGDMIKPTISDINRASNPLYVFIHPDTVKSYEDILLACIKEPKSASVNPEEYLKKLLEIIAGFESAIDEKIYQIQSLLYFFNEKIKQTTMTEAIVIGKKRKSRTYKDVDILVDLLNQKREEKNEYNEYIKNEVEKNHEFVNNTYVKSVGFTKSILEIPYRQSLDNLLDVTNNLYSIEADENLIKEKAILLDLKLESLSNIKLSEYIETTRVTTTSQDPAIPYIDLLIQFPKHITYEEESHKKCDFSFVVTSFETFLRLLEVKLITLPEMKC
jgi:hypothetical protein